MGVKQGDDRPLEGMGLKMGEGPLEELLLAAAGTGVEVRRPLFCLIGLVIGSGDAAAAENFCSRVDVQSVLPDEPAQALRLPAKKILKVNAWRAVRGIKFHIPLFGCTLSEF